MKNIAAALHVTELPRVIARMAKIISHVVIWIGSQRFRVNRSTTLEQKEPAAPPTPEAPRTIPIWSAENFPECSSTRNIRMRAWDTILVIAMSEDGSQI